MKKRATLNDIAQALAVNPSTVSRALNPSTSSLIGASQRIRIEEMASKLNYQPKLSARSLATSKSYSIGLALHSLETDFASPFFALLLASLSRSLYTKNYSLTILPIMNQKNRDEEILEYLKMGRVDGFLINSTLIGEKTLDFLSKENTPVVIFDHFGKLENRFCIVRTDDSKGAEELVDELWALGHRKTAYLMPDYVKDPLQRYIEYKNAWATKGTFFKHNDAFKYPQTIRGTLYDRIEAMNFTKKNIDLLLSYSAIICCSDLVAFGVIDALTERGIKVGKDISVVGYDNIEENPNYKSKKLFLTTVEKKYSQMGKMIGELLIEKIENPFMKPITKEVPSKLIKRNTLGEAR